MMKAAATMGGRDWSKLPGDIVDLILSKVCISDRDALGWICSFGNNASTKLKGPICFGLPRIILPKELTKLRACSRSVYCLDHQKLGKILMTRLGSWCVGSSHGWLILAHPLNHKTCLYNPFMDYQIPLPDQVFLGYDDERFPKRRAYFLSKGILSCDPGRLGECLVVVMYDDSHDGFAFLGVCRPGDEEFTWTSDLLSDEVGEVGVPYDNDNDSDDDEGEVDELIGEGGANNDELGNGDVGEDAQHHVVDDDADDANDNVEGGVDAQHDDEDDDDGGDDDDVVRDMEEVDAEGWLFSFSDFTFHKGKLYATRPNGKVYVFEIKNDEKISISWKLLRTEWKLRTKPERYTFVYLVESLSGELYMVVRVLNGGDTLFLWTEKFMVFKLDEGGDDDSEVVNWVRVESLGKEEALFVGQSHSQAVDVSVSQAFRGNCIYYTDVNKVSWVQLSSQKYEYKDTGVYCLDDDSTQSLPENFKSVIESYPHAVDYPPIWITPNPNIPSSV